jgi:hypothetical protein
MAKPIATTPPARNVQNYYCPRRRADCLICHFCFNLIHRQTGQHGERSPIYYSSLD